MGKPPYDGNDDDVVVEYRSIVRRYPWPGCRGPTCLNWFEATNLKPKPAAMFCDDPHCNQYQDLVDDFAVVFEELCFKD